MPPLSEANPPVGGRLQLFAARWDTFTQDQWVCRTVRHGFRIEFLERPPPPTGVRLTPVPRTPEAREALQNEIDALVHKGVVEHVPQEEAGEGFYSTFFVVPKKPEGLRPILNLKPFNTAVVRKGFKLDSVRSVRNELRRNDFAISLDLKDAYYHVPVDPAFRKFLRFSFQGSHLQFRALPFGLSSSPRAFCKCLAPILAWCHSQGFRVLAYLDDWLVLNQSSVTLREHSRLLIQKLQHLGWLISFQKSHLTPSQQFTFIGVDFDTVQNRMAPSLSRMDNLSSMVSLLQVTVPALRILEILGHMASMIDILPTTRLHMRNIQLCLLRQWKPKFNHIRMEITLSPEAKVDLHWWALRENMMQGAQIWPPEPQITVLTDACLEGWGAHCEEMAIQGLWSQAETRCHINFLEMKTVLLALQAWTPQLRGKRILLRSDNTTVVQYVNRQGGTVSPKLCRLTLEIWDLTLSQNMWIQAAHIAGKDNIIADDLSRGRGIPLSTEWSLCPVTVKWVFETLDRPLVDLFAHSSNAKLPTYCSWKKDRKAWKTDAFSVSWNALWAYAFPPLPLIPRVLSRAAQFHCRILLVAPRWERRPWFPSILQMLDDFPLEIPLHDKLLKLPGTDRFHPAPEFLKLTVWPISGIGSRCREFQSQLRNLCWHPGERVRRGYTLLSTASFPAGAVNGTLIPLIQVSKES